MGYEDKGRWVPGGRDLRVRRRWQGGGSLTRLGMAGSTGICILLCKAGGTGCVSEADIALRDARTVGRHGYPHRRRPSMRDGLPGKVGKDQATGNGVVKDVGAGFPPPTAPAGDPGFSHLRGSDISVVKPLHQRASFDDRLLEARSGGIRFQDEGERTGTGTSRLGREPGPTVPTGGQRGGRRHR